MNRNHKIVIAVAFLVISGCIFWKASFIHAEIVQKVAPRHEGSNGQAESADPPNTSTADVFPPFQVSAGSIITGINYKFNSTQDLVDAFSGASKKYALPSVDIVISNANIGPDHATGLVARTQNFDSLFTDQYFSWCLGTKENRITQNGIAAGGARIPSEGNGPDCYTKLQRSVAASHDVDGNKDGMGDKWETRYFGSGNVDPAADPDHDGFAMTLQNSIVGPKGFIKLVPDVTVNNIEYVTGDGKFTNAEEWVWGTNPIDPDSDDDGYNDEEDVSGKGQINFAYTPPANSKNGDSEFIELITDGYANYRQENGEVKLAKIANAGSALFVGNGDKLSGSLEYLVLNSTSQDVDTKQNKATATEDIYVGDEVELHAAIENSQDQESNLHYQWSFRLVDGGVDFPSDPTRVIDTVTSIPAQYAVSDSRIGKTGFGLNPYRLKIDKQAAGAEGTGFNVVPKTGNKIIAEVIVIEPETGKRADIIQEFPIATSVTLEFSPELPIQPLYPQAPLDSAPSYTVTADVPGLNPRNFLFEWYIDDTKQPNASIGGNTMSFKATKQIGKYKISVILTRVSDEKVFAQAIQYADVSPLRVDITNCPEFEDKDTLSTNQSITLQASVVAQGNFPGTLQYQWFMNNTPVTDPSESHIPSVTFVPQNIGSYNVTYHVESLPPTQATSEPFVPFSISQTCKISVTNEGAQSVSQNLSKLFASVAFVFPNVLRGVLTFFAIILVIFGIMYYVRNQHKKTL